MPTPRHARVTGLLAHKGSTWEALEKIVLHYDIPDSVIPEGASAEDALEVIFRQCNHVDGNEWISKAGFKARSLSCGDLVTIDGRHFICEGIGWLEVPQVMAEWVLANVTFRDFCNTLATTLRLLAKEGVVPTTPEAVAV